MTVSPFAYALMRKSDRALKSARIDLQHGDPDGAVNRAYYGMFNAARATLLAAGVSEGDLPRTHHGVIAAFGQHAVKTARVDATLGRSLNEAEGLRLKADYTGFEIGAKAAEDIVARAELFVQTVACEFGLTVVATEPDVAEAAPTENRDRVSDSQQRDQQKDTGKSQSPDNIDYDSDG